MKEDMEKMISVIIPVYNSENVIKRCVDSVINQSYKSLEIILVDDGSTDTSGEICDSYLHQDARIKVVHTANNGVSEARNIGIQMASGEYTMFVDADDWIDEKMCEVLYCYAEQYNNIDFIKSLAVNRYNTGKITENQPRPISTKVIDVEKEFSFIEQYAYGVVWGSLYKTNLLKDLSFEKGIYVGEDALFVARVLKKCKKVLIIQERFYNYVFYSDSACHGALDDKKITILTAWEKIADLFKENTRLYRSAKGACVDQCARLILRMEQRNEKNGKYWDVCRRTIKQNMSDAVWAIPMKSKIRLILAIFAPTLSSKLLKKIK